MNTSARFVENQLNHGKKSNRLIHEKSPYLLQHAFNPVDWYPWGNDAFVKARKEDKPIFLSIGYSTCYWCHVMEREVFEDTSIAALMNEKLVCIKVDREERPDIDRVYMTAVQAISGSGGWPMSVFMTPDRKPFFGGTYIPPTPQHGRPGFPDLVKRIDELWHTDRTKLLESSEQVTEMLQPQYGSPASAQPGDSALHVAYNQFLRSFDQRFAGFGTGPKFPRPSSFNFLLRYHARTGQDSALEMTSATLRAMAKGGVYDHIGGGFHRYSVDEQWRVPHFEKMLYDQAQLAVSYLEAYQVTHDHVFSRTAADVLGYVLRNLRDPQGGFYSAEDAESALDASNPHEKEEGVFYLWTASEIRNLVRAEEAEIFDYYYGVADTGNALHDPMNVFSGKNILYIAHSTEETAAAFNKTNDEIERILHGVKKRLFEEREMRPRPHLDDKVITAWNGLMISAFAKGYQVLEDEQYLAAATDAARFAMTRLYDHRTKRLFRRYRDNDARFEGGLQDYAFLVQGLLDLSEASFAYEWLDDAMKLTLKQNELFADTVHGGFFDNEGSDATVLVRTKEDYDGAEPTGNSVAALNLLRLAQISDDKKWREMADRTITSFASRLNEYPEIAPQMLVAIARNLSTPQEIIIIGSSSAEDTRMLLREVHAGFHPNKFVAVLGEGASKKQFEKLLPFTSQMHMLHGKATAYICEHYACNLPTSDPNIVTKLLETNGHP